MGEITGAASAPPTQAKHENWDVDLIVYCSKLRRIEISYGAIDCVLFAAGGVKSQTGDDFAAAHRGAYHDEDSAEDYMKSKGWDSIADIVDAHLPRIQPGERRRGDVLMFDGEYGQTLGICLGAVAAVLGTSGVINIPAKTCVAAWRVG